MRWMIGQQARWLAARGRLGGRLAPALVAALALALAWAAAGSPSTVYAADPGSAALNVVYPAPGADNVAKGPVGANVTISATGLTAADQYTLNVAAKDHTCAAATPVIGSPFSVNSDGTYNTTFPWPETAGSLGTSYILCLHDETTATATDVASQQAYLVQSTTAPTIAIKHTGSSTPTPGQPTPPALNNTTYYPGDQIQITGSGFVPPQTLGAFLGAAGSAPPATPADLGVGLQLKSGSLKSADDGSFTAIVQLPDATQLPPGSYQLCVASGDGSSNAPSAPPSLEACTALTVQAAPTPTPTVTATTAPATVTPGGGGTSGSGGTPKHLGAVIALGAVSVILFFVGVILLASAAAMPEPGMPGPGMPGPGNYQ